MATSKKLDFKKASLSALGIGAGATAAKFLNKPLAMVNPKIRAGVKIAAGIVIPTLLIKSDMGSNIGAGMIAIGATELLEQLVPGLAGIGDSEHDEDLIGDSFTTDEDFMAGDPYEPKIYGSSETPSTVI